MVSAIASATPLVGRSARKSRKKARKKVLGAEQSRWFHTYALSNHEAQRLTASLLGTFRDVQVQTTTRGGRPLVTVECAGPERAESLHDVIVTTDWGARLVAVSRGAVDALTA